MVRMTFAVAVLALAAGSSNVAAQARATTTARTTTARTTTDGAAAGIGEARRIVRRNAPTGLSTTGINLSEEARRREERDRRCSFDRRGYYDAYGRYYGDGRYGRYDGGYATGSYDNRTYVGGNRFNRDGRYDPNGRYDRDGRLLQMVPSGTTTTATTGTIPSSRISVNATYAAPPAAARVETARTSGGRYDDYASGCGYIDRGSRHR